MKHLRMAIAALLVVSAVNLSVMVPGGPVEARDFSAIAPVILGGFNLFLTLLGLGSLVLAFLIASGRYDGYFFAGLIGIGYFAIYAIDLAHNFPKSPTPRPSLLFGLEWLGAVLALPLTAASFFMAFHQMETARGSRPFVFSAPAILAMVVLALAIVTFATYSAMGL